MVSLQFLWVLLTVWCFTTGFAKKSSNKVSKEESTKDANDHKGLTPFFLQDPYDSQCLGPEGFTNCDERALWVLTRRQGKQTFSLVSFLGTSKDGTCLQRAPGFLGIFSSNKLKVGSCSKASAKAWDWEFLDKQLVRLSNQGLCVARGVSSHKAMISLESCSKSDALSLLYHPTSVHDHGFYLKSADGQCFDGEHFRSCTGAGSGNLLWGTGVRYVWGGDSQQYIFSFSKKEGNSMCLQKHGQKTRRGSCKDAAALGWAMHDGKLSYRRGQFCLARDAHDDSGLLLPCKDGAEYVTLEIPASYSTDELAAMLQDPNLTETQRTEIKSALMKSGRV